MTDNTVQYHYVCQQHGLVATSSIYEPARTLVTCPKCREFAELWLGTARDREAMMLSPDAKRQLAS